MKHVWLGLIVVQLVCLSVFAQSTGTQYVKGKIVSVEKVEKQGATSGGTDAPVASQVDNYNISIQVADTVYVCRYAAHSEQDLTWTRGKEGDVRIKGKTMYVRTATGKEAKASILRTTKAPTP